MNDSTPSPNSATPPKAAKEQLQLLGTSACHLCDEAKRLLDQLLNPDVFELHLVDIAQSDLMIDQYGTRIPVLIRLDTHSELNWPFGIDQVIDFLS